MLDHVAIQCADIAASSGRVLCRDRRRQDVVCRDREVLGSWQLDQGAGAAQHGYAIDRGAIDQWQIERGMHLDAGAFDVPAPGHDDGERPRELVAVEAVNGGGGGTRCPTGIADVEHHSDAFRSSRRRREGGAEDPRSGAFEARCGLGHDVGDR